MVGKSTDSADKSPVGKDDSAGTKTGKRVHFDSEDSLEVQALVVNGKVNTSPAKDGEKTENGGNKAAEKVLALLVVNSKPEEEVPEISTCLMDSEAAEMLLAVQDQMAFLSQDPDIKVPVSFDWGLTYAKRDGNNVEAQTISEILEPLKKYGVSDCEICQIANIGPESVHEVFALVPTLKPKMSEIREPLRIALDKLASLKGSV